MNFENSKTSEPHRLLLNLADKINVKRSDKYVALSNISMCYTFLTSGHVLRRKSNTRKSSTSRVAISSSNILSRSPKFSLSKILL